MEKSRIAGIDTLRVISIIAVICLHTYPFLDLAKQNICFKYTFYAISNLCRFAVPFFFIISGYLFGKNMRLLGMSPRSFNLLFRYLKRLSIIFFSWSLIYTFLPSYIPLKTMIRDKFSFDYFALLSKQPLDIFHFMQKRPLDFILQGGSTPLWFITALMLALIIVTGVYKLNKEKYLFLIAIPVYLFGLLAKAGYGDTPLGVHLPFLFNTRNGLFMSLLFVSIGWWISGKKKFHPKTWQAIAMITAGFLLQGFEAYLLWKYYHVTPLFDYLVGTVPFGFGVFLLALSRPDMGRFTLLPKIGSLALGIYVSHSLFLPYVQYCFSPVFPVILWQMIYPLLVFTFSAIFIYFLRRVPLVKVIVA